MTRNAPVELGKEQNIVDHRWLVASDWERLLFFLCFLAQMETKSSCCEVLRETGMSDGA